MTAFIPNATGIATIVQVRILVNVLQPAIHAALPAIMAVAIFTHVSVSKSTLCSFAIL